jgi:hypothetical protein
MWTAPVRLVRRHALCSLGFAAMGASGPPFIHPHRQRMGEPHRQPVPEQWAAGEALTGWQGEAPALLCSALLASCPRQSCVLRDYTWSKPPPPP